MWDCYSKKHIFGRVALFKFEFAQAKSERPLNQITTEMWVTKFREDKTENQGNWNTIFGIQTVDSCRTSTIKWWLRWFRAVALRCSEFALMIGRANARKFSFVISSRRKFDFYQLVWQQIFLFRSRSCARKNCIIRDGVHTAHGSNVFQQVTFFVVFRECKIPQWFFSPFVFQVIL